MHIIPYLNFDGTCAEAFRYYEQALGGRIATIQTIGDTPMKDQHPPEHHGRVMHVRLEVGGQILMGSDSQPGHHAKPQGITVMLQVKDPADGARAFTALGEGGRVTMPFDKTFWSPGFGMLVDRYGIPWMVNCDPAA